MRASSEVGPARTAPGRGQVRCLGSSDRYLGMLGAVGGDLDAAQHHLATAIEAHERNASPRPPHAWSLPVTPDRTTTLADRSPLLPSTCLARVRASARRAGAGSWLGGGTLASTFHPHVATVTTTVDPRAVHVQVRLDGDLGPLVGHARAAASPDGTIRAAAQATIDALAPRLPGASIRVETLAHLPEAAAPHVTAIVTVIRHDRVHQLVGSALAHHSPAHAAAEATLRAVQEALDDPDDLAPDLDAAAPTPEDLDASSLLAVASHQLRGPVGVLAGYLELLTARWPSLDDLARQQMADRAATQGQRIMHRLDNLLTITTHRSTRPRATPAVAAVRDLVVQAVDDLPAVDLADVTIEVPEGLLVLADVDHVRQIVANLIDNARRHGAPPVTVTAAHVGRDRVRTCVADGGAGVPASHRAHLFDPQRPDRSVTAGSGLGLHITRLLASANQGSVDYLPDPAGGSRFCLVLPAPAHTGAGAAAWDAGRRALGQAPARS